MIVYNMLYVFYIDYNANYWKAMMSQLGLIIWEVALKIRFSTLQIVKNQLIDVEKVIDEFNSSEPVSGQRLALTWLIIYVYNLFFSVRYCIFT